MNFFLTHLEQCITLGFAKLSIWVWSSKSVPRLRKYTSILRQISAAALSTKVTHDDWLVCWFGVTSFHIARYTQRHQGGRGDGGASTLTIDNDNIASLGHVRPSTFVRRDKTNHWPTVQPHIRKQSQTQQKATKTARNKEEEEDKNEPDRKRSREDISTRGSAAEVGEAKITRL